MLQGLNVAKGGSLDITKGTKVTKVKVAIGWRAETAPGKPSCDVDAAVFGRTQSGKLVSFEDVLYFNSPKVPGSKQLQIYNGGLIHSGDDLVGGKPGDCETITMELSRIPAHVFKESIVINIDKAVDKLQNFGNVKGVYARVEDAETNEVLGTYNISENYAQFTAIHVGDVERQGTDWVFTAIGEGKDHGAMNGNLNGFVQEWS